jgi:hypothetical protein
MYINTTTNQVVSEAQIRAENPNTSFPNPFPVPDGYAYIFPAPATSHDPMTQTVRQIAPVLTVKGTYEEQWEVVNLDAQTIAANQAVAKARSDEAIKAQIAVLDLKRIRPLAEGDATYLADLNAQIIALRAQL